MNEELQTIARSILEESLRAGASQAEVSIAKNKGFSVAVHDQDVERVEYHQDKVVEINVFFGKRSGSAGITDLRKEAITAAVNAACHIARFTDEDPPGGLADKAELGFHYPQLLLCKPWDISEEKAIELAKQCEYEGLQVDKRIMAAEEVNVTTSEAFHLYANTHDFLGYYPYSRHEISCILVAKDKEGMQRDYSYTLASDPTQLESVSQLAKEAAKRTVARLNARRLNTMKAPILFAAEEARSLIGHFIQAIAGTNIYRKTSFLVDHLGKKVFPDFVRLQEHPHIPYGLGSAPFDDDGVLTRDNVFVEGGILQQYVLGVYSARKLNMTSTGNAGGIHNLTITPGTKNFAELVKTMHRGLIVTEVMGQGVNLVTGDYSRGISGFWVEHGEIQYPVHEVTIAGNLKNMFAKLTEIGTDVDLRGNIRTGSLLIAEMMIAGS